MDTSTRTEQALSYETHIPGKRNMPETRPLLVLLLLCSAQFMVVLDFSIVNIALPIIQRELGFSPQNLQWVVTAYSLTFGGFLLLGGRLGDLFGKRRLFIIGLAIFAVTSLLGGIAQSVLWLVVARALQGLGGAIISPTSFSLLTTTFHEGPPRNKALGVVGAVASSGFAAGAILGGVLTAGPGWRWVFFVNVPIALITALCTPLLLRETGKPQGRPQVDIIGAVCVTIGLVALVYTLSQGNEIGWTSLQTLSLLAVGLLFLIVFVIVESRVKAPLIRLSIFRSRTLTGANLVGLLVPGLLGATVFIITLYMQKVLNYDAITTGLAFLPMAFPLMFLSNIVSRFVPLVGVQRLIVGGLLVVALGLLLLTRISIENNYAATLLPGTLVIGLGIAPVFTAMAVAATSGINDEEQGLATGLLNTSQQVGSGVVLALIAVVSAIRTAALQHTAGGDKVALVGGFQAALLACIALSFLAVLIALFLIRQRAHPPVADVSPWNH